MQLHGLAHVLESSAAVVEPATQRMQGPSRQPETPNLRCSASGSSKGAAAVQL